MFQKKDKLALYDEEKILLSVCRFNDIFQCMSYVIISGLNVIKENKNDNNLYDYYLSKAKLIKGLKKLKRKDFDK